MSTQTPITTEPTACSTNWLTRLTCKFQALVEPLCEKRSGFALTLYEQIVVLSELSKICNHSFHVAVAGYCTATAVSQAVARWERENNQTIVLSPQVLEILAPRLSLWNKIGLGAWKAFSVGTTCSCCWGWRLIISSIVVFLSGFLLAKA